MDLLPSRNTFNYYKGNLHGHSNHSDGALKPNEVVNEYKNLGYDFTCLSDHLWKNENFANDGSTILLISLVGIYIFHKIIIITYKLTIYNNLWDLFRLSLFHN